MFQRNMWSQHFRASLSLEELAAIEEAKESATSSPPSPVLFPTSSLSLGQRMFRPHFHQPKCDSCYASKVANNEALRAYQSLVSVQEETQNPTLLIPSKPKQIPFITVLK